MNFMVEKLSHNQLEIIDEQLFSIHKKISKAVLNNNKLKYID